MVATTGISRRRVDEVIDLVGLQDVADRRAGAFSLGMDQRLGIASALLGDPGTLILDEPVNGRTPRASCGSAPCSQAWPTGSRTSFVARPAASSVLPLHPRPARSGSRAWRINWPRCPAARGYGTRRRERRGSGAVTATSLVAAGGSWAGYAAGSSRLARSLLIGLAL